MVLYKTNVDLMVLICPTLSQQLRFLKFCAAPGKNKHGPKIQSQIIYPRPCIPLLCKVFRQKILEKNKKWLKIPPVGSWYAKQVAYNRYISEKAKFKATVD